MNVQNWIEVLGLVVGAGGGGKLGVTVITRLTRLVVAVETLTGQLEKLAGQHEATAARVNDHENRLNRANL